MPLRTAIIALALILSLAPTSLASPEGDAAPAAVGDPAATTVSAPGPPTAQDAATPVAKPPAPLEGDEVLVTAEHLERSNQDRIVIGEGAVTIRHREMRLLADRVVYNELTRGVIADGNVVLDSGPDRLQGEHLELNLETRIGFLEHAQGFLQTYYFTGERIEKRGPDNYYLRGGTFTTCEGVRPDWSFHTSSAELTIDEYMHAWNPTLKIGRLPLLYFPYAIFPIKRDRSTGLLIPRFGITGVDGVTIRNAFYWAPRDNFDATIGIDYLEKTGWGASGEMRYLLGLRTQGVINGSLLRNTGTDAERWSLATRNSHELPLGIHAEIEAFFQSDREYLATQGKTIEERSSERTTSSFFINRSWSAWNFALAGRNEVSLLTENRTTLTRFPELTIDRTSTALFGTGLFLKVAASGVNLKRDDSTSTISTTRLHVSPETTWPLSISSVARIIPLAGYGLTKYSENTLGVEETRSIPFFRLGLEGPRPYRIWDLSETGRFAKLKHLIEPSISYVYTPVVNQDTIPQFDSLDRIAPANRMEYSLSNTLYAKVRSPAVPIPAQAPGQSPYLAPVEVAEPGHVLFLDTANTVIPLLPEFAATVDSSDLTPQGPLTTTQELLWIKLSQNYTFDSSRATVAGQSFSAVEWEARTRPLSGLEISWRGDYDVYGKGVGYHNLSLIWSASGSAWFQGDWRSTRESNQDFLDLGGNYSFRRIDVHARGRYNLAEKSFIEKQISLKYSSQCWDVTISYVKWTTDYQFSLTFSLKGIGTIVGINSAAPG